jgi:hypothetical protein
VFSFWSDTDDNNRRNHLPDHLHADTVSSNQHLPEDSMLRIAAEDRKGLPSLLL